MKYRHQWVFWAVAIALTQCGQLDEQVTEEPPPAPTGTTSPKTAMGKVDGGAAGKGGASGSSGDPSTRASRATGRKKAATEGKVSSAGAPPMGAPPGRPQLPLSPLREGRFAYNSFVARPHWVRGSGHTHAAPDHSGVPASEQETRLRDLPRPHAHRFAWLTAHTFVAPDPRVPGILHMFGTEAYSAETSEGAWPHLLVYLPDGSLADPQGSPFGLRKQTLAELIESVDRVGGLAALAHPDRSRLTDAELAELDHRLWGIEVMSGASDIDENAEVLDRRLSSGMFTCITGGGDLHDDAGRMTRGYMVVNVRDSSPTRRALFEATRACNFVVCRVQSTDVVPLEPLSVRIDDSVVTITANRAAEIRFIGDEGHRLAGATARSARYELDGDERYVRAELIADTGRAHCLTQPIWILDGAQVEEGD